jgi:hypothetical protein
MASVIILNVAILSVVMPSGIIVNVAAPNFQPNNLYNIDKRLKKLFPPYLWRHDFLNSDTQSNDVFCRSI